MDSETYYPISYLYAMYAQSLYYIWRRKIIYQILEYHQRYLFASVHFRPSEVTDKSMWYALVHLLELLISDDLSILVFVDQVQEVDLG